MQKKCCEERQNALGLVERGAARAVRPASAGPLDDGPTVRAGPVCHGERPTRLSAVGHAEIVDQLESMGIGGTVARPESQLYRGCIARNRGCIAAVIKL